MAVPSLRVVRQPNRRTRTLTAASAPITDVTKVFRSTMSTVSGGRDWQSEGWDMYDAVGELRYYVGWRAASCSRVRFVASDIDPETGMPTGSTDNKRVNDIVKSIADGPLGQAQYIRRSVECLSIPGEYWSAILATKTGEQWLAVNKEEIRRNGRGVEIELPDGSHHEVVMPRDSLFRVWNPRARRASEPDSPVRACLDPLHEIVRTTKTISNASKSRLVGNGVVFVPQEMSLPPVTTPLPTNGGPVFATEGVSAVAQLQELLWSVANTAYDDEDSMAALIPMFATVPGDQIKNVQHLKFDNQVTDVAIKVRNDAIARLAMGLDVSPERLLGLGTNQNHWNAWLTTDQDVSIHIAPVMETVCQALNDNVLQAILEREGLATPGEPPKFMLWYDAGELTADPDKTDNATAAFDRGAINAEAYRDYLGLESDAGYDYSTLEGWQLWAQDTVSRHPELLSTYAPLLPITDVIPELNPTYIPPGLEAAPPGQPPPDQNAPQSEPQTENQPPPDQQPQAARAEVASAIVDLMVGRALELAGKRRRTRADHSRLAAVPMHETHRYMPPAADSQISRLIDGWDAALEAEVLARVNIDIEDLRAAVRRRARAELTAPMVDA